MGLSYGPSWLRGAEKASMSGQEKEKPPTTCKRKGKMADVLCRLRRGKVRNGRPPPNKKKCRAIVPKNGIQRKKAPDLQESQGDLLKRHCT